MCAWSCSKGLRSGREGEGERARESTGRGTGECPACKAARAFNIRPGAPKLRARSSAGVAKRTAEVEQSHLTKRISRRPEQKREVLVAGTGKHKASEAVHNDMSNDQWGWRARQA